MPLRAAMVLVVGTDHVSRVEVSGEDGSVKYIRQRVEVATWRGDLLVRIQNLAGKGVLTDISPSVQRTLPIAV